MREGSRARKEKEKGEMDKVLREVYYNLDNPATYSGIRNVWLEAKKQLPKLKLREVKDWLAD